MRQGGPGFSCRKSQPWQLSAPAQSSTHVWEGEFAEGYIVALLANLLHQRADHQLRVQAWKPSRAQPNQQQEETPKPSP